MNDDLELDVLEKYLRTMLGLITEFKMIRETNKCLNQENQDMRARIEAFTVDKPSM